jgi:tetratricopeptide (TPR) repeat protein
MIPAQRRLGIFILFLFSLAAVSLYSQELSKEEKLARRKTVRALLKSAHQRIENEQYDSAQVELDSLLLIDPRNADGHYLKGWLFCKKGDTTSAMSILAVGIEAAPLSTRLRILSARLSLAQNQPEEALAVLEPVLAIKPKESQALYLKGAALLNKGDTAQAIGYLEKALKYGLEKK